MRFADLVASPPMTSKGRSAPNTIRNGRTKNGTSVCAMDAPAIAAGRPDTTRRPASAARRCCLCCRKSCRATCPSGPAGTPCFPTRGKYQQRFVPVNTRRTSVTWSGSPSVTWSGSPSVTWSGIRSVTWSGIRLRKQQTCAWRLTRLLTGGDSGQGPPADNHLSLCASSDCRVSVDSWSAGSVSPGSWSPGSWPAGASSAAVWLAGSVRCQGLFRISQ
jgi:hypothetical protein